MARIDELRLMAKVARLYYVRGLRQTDITDRLGIHHSTVSRVLRRAEKEGIVRITFTAPLINQAKVVEFLVAGADKSASLYEVLEGSGSADQFPSKMIHPVSGQLIWLVDKAAAASLSRKSA